MHTLLHRIRLAPFWMFPLVSTVPLLAAAFASDAAFRLAVAHTLGIAIPALLAGVPSGGLTALAMRRCRSIALLPVLLLLPPGWILACAGLRHLLPSTLVLCLAYAALCALISALVIRWGLSHIPRTVDEAAASLGAGPREILRRVTLPIAWSSVPAAAMVSLAVLLSEGMLATALRSSRWEMLGPRLWASTAAGQILAPLLVLLSQALLLAGAWRATSIIPAASVPRPAAPSPSPRPGAK